jgi:hypothetical protein
MAKAKLNVEFPCGYKLNTEVDVGMFGAFTIDDDGYKECPLHGKNCPPKSRTKKSSHVQNKLSSKQEEK